MAHEILAYIHLRHSSKISTRFSNIFCQETTVDGNKGSEEGQGDQALGSSGKPYEMKFKRGSCTTRDFQKDAPLNISLFEKERAFLHLISHQGLGAPRCHLNLLEEIVIGGKSWLRLEQSFLPNQGRAF